MGQNSLTWSTFVQLIRSLNGWNEFRGIKLGTNISRLQFNSIRSLLHYSLHTLLAIVRFGLALNSQDTIYPPSFVVYIVSILLFICSHRTQIHGTIARSKQTKHGNAYSIPSCFPFRPNRFVRIRIAATVCCDLALDFV